MSNTPTFSPFFVSPVILEKDKCILASEDWCVKEDFIQSVIISEDSNVCKSIIDADRIEIENLVVNRNDSLIKVLFVFPKYITQFFDLDLQDKATNKALCSYMSIMYANILCELTKSGVMCEHLVVLVNREFKRNNTTLLFDYLYQCCAKVDVHWCVGKRVSEVFVNVLQAGVDLERIRGCCLMYLNELFKSTSSKIEGRDWESLNSAERSLVENHKFVYVDKFTRDPTKVSIYQSVCTNPDDVVLRTLSRMFVPPVNKRNLEVIELITSLCNIKSDINKFIEKINTADMGDDNAGCGLLPYIERVFSQWLIGYYQKPRISVLFVDRTQLKGDSGDFMPKSCVVPSSLIGRLVVIKFANDSDVISISLDELLSRIDYYSSMLMRV